MFNPFKKKASEGIKPCGIARTVHEKPASFDEVFLNAKEQLMVEVPKHRKPHRFYLNKLKVA